MPTQKLTAKTIENAKAPKTGRTELWDSIVGGDAAVPGAFGLRVTSRGVKTWTIMYRLHGKQRRLRIGTFPAHGLSEAREMARDALLKVGRGIDPAEERKATQESLADPDTVEKVTANFILRYAKPKNRSWKETERVFDRYVLPRWGKRPIESVSSKDVHSLLDDIVDQGSPYMGNRVLATLSRFFNWCLERDLLVASPAAHIKPPAEEKARDRVLNNDEISTLWPVWESMGWPFGSIFKLLLITGQRRTEIATMRWSEVDLDNRLWTLPRKATKSDRLHEVPLTPLAIEILDATPRMGEFVFTTNGKTPVSGFSKAKIRCDEIADVKPWRIHDLRRTAATGLARLRIAPHVVEKILNHSSGTISGVAAIYNKHGYSEEKLAALTAWSRKLETIIRPTKNNVVKIHG